MHKEANALMENGKYAEARDIFVKTAELYYKGQNYFGSAEMYYKAGECAVALKDIRERRGIVHEIRRHLVWQGI